MRLIKRLTNYFNYLTSGQPASLPTNTGTSRSQASPSTSLHDASLSERDAYWKTRQEITPQDQMREWVRGMEAMLEPFKTDATQREQLAFLRRLLKTNTSQSLDTVEVTASAIYRLFFQEARGDIESFARRVVSTNTRDEIHRNQALIGQLARIYGDQTATRAWPLIAALKDAQEPINGHPASAPARNFSNLHTIIGTDSKTERDVTITQRAKQQGVYIIGGNGTGKTTMVENMVLSDIQNGLGVAVVEPHGDLTARILAGIPRHRLNDIVFLDVEDWEYPFGLNLFEVSQPSTISTIAATASFISHLWEVLWSSGYDTPRLMQNLRAVTRTLSANPGSTFGDIPLLYSSEEVRARMLANVTNPQILTFFEEYERMNFRDRRLFTESTLNKVTAFLDEPMIQHILSQSKTTINFRYIMDNSKILLIKLSPQFEEASRLIGAVIIGKLLMTAFSRADTPEKDRKQFNLYCDEFHRFASSDFATLISEARKFRISTIISHQTLTQLSEQNRASALASGNIIVFRVSGDDSRVLSRSFDTTPARIINGEEVVRAPVADVITHLVRRGHNDPRVARFGTTYLANLERFLNKPPGPCGPQYTAYYYNCLDDAISLTQQQVVWGREFLNESLYQAMLEKRFDLQLPTLAIYILAVAQQDGREYILSNWVTKSFHEFTGFKPGAEKFGKPSFIAPFKSQEYISQISKALKKRYVWMAQEIGVPT